MNRDRIFSKAIQRVGRVWKIVHVMSINPRILRDSMRLYIPVMRGPSRLSRIQRELLATVVSAELDYKYCTQAHAHDLREEVAKELSSPQDADRYVQAVARDWRTAPLSPQDRALCEFAAKLTRHQERMTAEDLEALRAYGLDDQEIQDAAHVIGYFNYLTRSADSLGVEPESFIRPWGD